MAAEIYDRHIFHGGTFGDILARGGPAIVINATDVTAGTTFAFIQDYFDLLCSDISDYPVSRATAASSAVPVVLSPISLRNYAGECGYASEWIGEALEQKKTNPRRYHLAVHAEPYLDPEKKPYVHLVDGGVADNLALRISINRITHMGNVWHTMKRAGAENTQKVIILVVNAETGVDTSPDRDESPPGILEVLSSVTSTPLSKYNFETINHLTSNFAKWEEQIRSGRCNDPDYKGDTACDDIKFYMIQVSFNDIPDEKEREYFKGLPTSFKLDDETVDNLREIAGRLLNESDVYQELMREVKK
jgi:NTE family protein